MKSFTLMWLCCCCILFSSFQAQGAERYISDILVIMLRDGPSRTSNIVGHLRSGDYMTILSEDKENGYLHVRVSSGIEGWVPKKYTNEGKSKDTIIHNLKKSILTLKETAQSQKDKIDGMADQVNDYQSTIDVSATTEAKQQAYILDLEKQVTDAQDKYITLKDQAEGVEAAYEEKNLLQIENASLSKKLIVVEQENQELDQTKNIFWFLTGAGVLLIGFIMGRSGRKSRRNSLTL